MSNMDLENNRIPTRVKLPHIPVTEPMAVILPKTARTDRLVGTVTGFILSTLGVSAEDLCGADNAQAALENATDRTVPRNIFREVDKAWAKQQVKTAYKAMRDELATHSTFLTSAFGAAPLAVAKGHVDRVLADYQIVDNQ